MNWFGDDRSQTGKRLAETEKDVPEMLEDFLHTSVGGNMKRKVFSFHSKL